MLSEKKQEEGLAPTMSHPQGEVIEGSHDAVFGEITEDGPNYRNVCSSCRRLCIASQSNGHRSDGSEPPF